MIYYYRLVARLGAFVGRTQVTYRMSKKARSEFIPRTVKGITG